MMPDRKRGKRRGGRKRDGARIARVAELYAEHIRGPEIQRIVSSEFDCSERTVREDLARLEDELARELEALEGPPPRRRARHRATLVRILTLSLEWKKPAAALGAWDRLARLDRIFEAPAQGQEETGRGGIIARVELMTTDERRRRLAEILGLPDPVIPTAPTEGAITPGDDL